MKKRTSLLIGILVSIVVVLGIVGLILFLPARDTTARSYCLAIALFPIGLAVAAWFFFVGIPGFIALVLEKIFLVDKEQASYTARYILLGLFLLCVIAGIISEVTSR